MPLYQYRCPVCSREESAFRSIDERRNGPVCCEQMTVVITPPHVIDDMKPYRSPIDGEIINSRNQHRAHKRKHGVVEVGNEPLRPPKSYEPTGIVDDIKRAMGD